jgi:hypothetical protein
MSHQTQEGGVVKIAVLGTGIVGNAVATKLAKIGHPHFNLRLIVSNKQPNLGGNP